MQSKCIITFNGLNVKHLLTALCRRNITVWSVYKSGSDCTITVSARQSRQAIAILREKCYNILNIRYTGLSAAVLFVKKHCVLPIICALCIALIAISSQFCLKIIISGDYSYGDVLNALAETDVFVGCNMSHFDADRTENSLASKLDAMYAVINRKGSVLYVNVVAKKSADPPIDMNRRRDIIALRSGTVLNIVCEQGTAVVKAGDKVAVGDVLIKGERTYADGTFDEVYALGNVTLQISVDGFAVFNGYKSETRETGNVFSCTGVVLWGKEYSAKCPFDSYIIATQSSFLYPLNLEIRRNVYRETQTVSVKATIGECLQQLRQTAYEQAITQCDFAVTSAEYVTYADGVKAVLYGTVHIT